MLFSGDPVIQTAGRYPEMVGKNNRIRHLSGRMIENRFFFNVIVYDERKKS
jgi:hypothetical protein